MNTYQYVAYINHKDNEVKTLHEYKSNFSITSLVTVEFNDGRRFTGKVKATNEEDAKRNILYYFSNAH